MYNVSKTLQMFCYFIPKNIFVQIRDFVGKMFPQFPAPPSCSPFDHLLENPPRWKDIISTPYCKILVPVYKSISQIKVLWEDDLEMVISDEDWNQSYTEYTNLQSVQDIYFWSAKLYTVYTGQSWNSLSTFRI